MSTPDARSALERASRQWATLGDEDPLWAVLSDRGRRGGRWEVTEFLDSGTSEISRVLEELRRIGIAPVEGTALDFGCGAGRLTQALAARLGDAVGVDVSEPMLEQARRLNRLGDRCRFLLNQQPDLRILDDDTVDLVYSCRVLQHVDPDLARSYVSEFFRVARPAAPVVFQVPSHPSWRPKGLAVRLLPEALANRLRRGMEMHGTPPPEVERWVRDAGGRVLATQPDDSAGPGWHSWLYLCVGPG